MTGKEPTHAILAENKLARGSGAHSCPGADPTVVGADADVTMIDAFVPQAGVLGG